MSRRRPSLLVDFPHLALVASLTGQEKTLVLAESDATFFFRASIAQITCNRDASGAVTGMTLHQNGQDATALPVNN